MQVKLNKETGRYELLNGGWLSSPSRILRPLTIDKFKDIPKHFLAMAAEFGKKAHSNVEMFEKLGGDNFAADEIAEIRTKRLETQMDLTEKQRKSIYKMHKENAIENKKLRETRMQTRKNRQQQTKEDRLKFENRRLDNQLRTKKHLKSILSDEQFKKWESNSTKQNMRKNNRTSKNGMKRNSSRRRNR